MIVYFSGAFLCFSMLLISFILIIYIYIDIQKIKKTTQEKESYCHCSGIQYNGIYIQEHPNDFICPYNTANPWRGGGCTQSKNGNEENNIESV